MADLFITELLATPNMEPFGAALRHRKSFDGRFYFFLHQSALSVRYTTAVASPLTTAAQRL